MGLSSRRREQRRASPDAGAIVTTECEGQVHRLRIADSGRVQFLDHNYTDDEVVLEALGGASPSACADLAASWRAARVDKLPPRLVDLAFDRWRRAGLEPNDVWVLLSLMNQTTRVVPTAFDPRRFDELATAASELDLQFDRFPTPEEVASSRWAQGR